MELSARSQFNDVPYCKFNQYIIISACHVGRLRGPVSDTFSEVFVESHFTADFNTVFR